MIWISHLHADHHLGTASVIRAWYRLVHNGVPNKTLPSVSSLATEASKYGLSVVSHEGMLKWLYEYSAVEDFGFSRILPLEISPVNYGADSGSKLTLTIGNVLNNENRVLKATQYEAILGLADIQSCKVSHCHGAMAVSMTFPRSPSDPEHVNPLKISYSGDCRPSKNFSHIGRNSTVLIHEATFDDELQGDAIAKKHSTTSEALGVGAQMDAKAVVLTHFSQRYQKIPVLQTVQDGEQADELLSPAAMEDVQREEEYDVDDAPADNMDATASRPSASTRPPPPSLPHPPPPSLPHQQSPSTGEHECIIKVRAKNMKVAIAFDYMRVRIGAIAQMEKFTDALNKLLVKEEEEGEEAGAEGTVNANGKKTSGDEGGGGKKKKIKRNN